MKNNRNENKAKKVRNYELERCVLADNAEMARNTNEDGPCDDNRA